MNIILFWIGFIILMSFSEELDQAHFLLFSGSMFYFTYLQNRINPAVLSTKMILILFNIPTIILGYITFVYNDFLCLNPISSEMFMSLFFIYASVTLYLFINFSRELCKIVFFTNYKLFCANC
jgi:hypothetical protein